MGQTILLLLPVFMATVSGTVPASSWNIPGHMLSAAIAYQVLSQENPKTIEKVKSSVGETSLVREPMAGQAWRRSHRRSEPRAVYAGGQVTRFVRTRDKAQIDRLGIASTSL